MAHRHDLTPLRAFPRGAQHHGVTEEEHGKVYHEEHILAQVMIEEDAFPESDAYDVVVRNPAFSPPEASSSATTTTTTTTTSSSSSSSHKPLPTPPPHRRPPALRTLLRSEEGPPAPSPAPAPAQEEEEEEEMPHQHDVDDLSHHHHHHHDDGDGDDGRQSVPLLPLPVSVPVPAQEEEHGRKLRSPRADLVAEVLAVSDGEQRRQKQPPPPQQRQLQHHHDRRQVQHHQQHQQQEEEEKEERQSARCRLPPGAVGWGKIVPPNFALRKSPSSSSSSSSSSLSSSSSSSGRRRGGPSIPGPKGPEEGLNNVSPHHDATMGGARAPHAQLLLRTAASSKRRPRFPAADMDHTDEAAAAGEVGGPDKPMPQKGRRRAHTVAAPPSSSREEEGRPRRGLGSSASCGSAAPMSRAEQERRVRKESMEYLLECPLPPLPEAEWWDPAAADDDEEDGAAFYDDIDISGDGDEPATPQPGHYGGSLPSRLLHGYKKASSSCSSSSSSSHSAVVVGSVQEGEEASSEHRHRRCLLQ